MSTIIRREIPLLIITMLGITMIADYFINIPSIKSAASILTSWASIVAGFAIIYGALSLMLSNTKYVIKKTPNRWWYSLCIITSFLVTTIFGLIPPFTTHWVFSWMYNYTYLPPSGTIYGMLAFYMVSAAYRAVKIRNIESATFAICAFFLIMKNAPIVTSSTKVFFDVGDWIMNVPSAAGWRAFYIGAAIGTIALAIRTFIWRERGAVGE
ncbi:hypothetical protein KEJ17_03090 [Candidatus Bathyarchaeota archaeon]|nr:hypothetical protein [Candidatus Bathyarchaeota archaeon]